MITFKEAFRIARERISQEYKIIGAIEAKDFYVFPDESGQEYPIGYHPVCVKKEDGTIHYLPVSQLIRICNDKPLLDISSMPQ